MGPEATIALMQRVVDQVKATDAVSDDCDHVPLIVDHNTQVPSRIEAILEGGKNDPGPVLAKGAKILRDAGAEALAMPCNTAHHYRDQITSAGLPFLDMIKLTADKAQKMGGPFGILGSPAIARIGLFEAELGDVFYPSDQPQLITAIRMIKRDGADAVARKILASASQELLSKGAAVQIIACTEFSLIADVVQSPVIDTLDVLAEAVVAFSNGDG